MHYKNNEWLPNKHIRNGETEEENKRDEIILCYDEDRPTLLSILSSFKKPLVLPFAHSKMFAGCVTNFPFSKPGTLYSYRFQTAQVQESKNKERFSEANGTVLQTHFYFLI
jgi:hypothetical protein